MKRNKLLGMVMAAVLSLALTACGDAASKAPEASVKTGTSVAAVSTESKTSTSVQMWDDLPEGEIPEGYIDENGYIYGDVEGYTEVDPYGEAYDPYAGGEAQGGEYSLEYVLSSGWRMDGDEKITFHLGGTVTYENASDVQLEWYNEHRPFVYAMFFPNLNGERVCQLYLDFATFEQDDEIFVNLPYDAPNGTFDNDSAVHYDAQGAIDNGGNLRINFPITVSGLGGSILDITDGIDGMHYIFSLKATNR